MSESEDDEDFMAAKMASMLSNYYGTVEDPADEHGDGGGADSPAHAAQAEDNIDSSNFDASEYAVNMLQNESLAGLLERDATLVQEIKSIDSDMKMLVHENYNKFISATDTIRSMRHNVDEMEEKMDELRQDMESIYGKAEEITSQLAPARTKIEKLVSVRQLLKKLEFLFELPLRLSRSIELKAYAQAVKYYSTARGVLNDHLDVPSFRNILVEADAIISKLKTDIQTWIQGDITAPKLAQYMKLLLSLQDNGDNADSDSSLLHVRYMEWHRERLTWMLHRHSPEVAADGSAEPPEPDGWPFEALSVDAFVESLKRSVVQGFVDMCHMYVGIFGHAGLGTRAGDLHPDLLQFGSDLFLDFFGLCKKKILSSPAATTAPVGAAATTTADGHGEDAGGGEDTGRGGRGGRGRPDKEVVAAIGRRGGLGPLSAALQAMQQCAQLIHQVVPSFRAHARLAETLENVVRHRVQATFHTLHASTVDRLLRACAAVSVSTPALTSDGSRHAPMSAALDPDSARATAQQVVDDIGRVLGSLRPLVELGADSAIVTDMPRIFCDLLQRQLHGYFLWLNNALQALAENDDPSIIVAVVDARERDGGGAGGADDGLPGAPGTGASAGAGNDSDVPTGLGVDIPDKPRVTPASAGIALLMACISRRLETHGVTDAKAMLATHLPQLGLSARPDHEDERARGRGRGRHHDGGDADAGGALDVRELVKQARATTQSLLERYVHLLADHLADIVAAQFSGADWLRHGEPRAVSPYCTECFLALGAVVDEVRRLTDNPDFELCTIPRRPVFKVPTVAGGSGGGGGGRASGSDGRRASGGGGGGGGDAGGAHGAAADGTEPGIRLNIERLFTQKLRLYEGITFAPQTIVTACVAATLKTLYEAARLCTFAKFGFQQAQIDASFLRVMLPRFGVKVDQGGLDTLLDEFVASVHARCVAPMDVDVAVVDAMIRYKRDELGV